MVLGAILMSICFGYFTALVMVYEDPKRPDKFWESSYFWITILIFMLGGLVFGSVCQSMLY